MPLISVIVPVYKVEQYLPRCVDSILNQTFQDYEIILVDDGSPDQCPQMCDQYAAQYQNIIALHKSNGGLSDARNHGIEYSLSHSDSEYITFVDSDDWIHPQYLELHYYAVLKTHADLSCSKLMRTKEYREMNYIDDYELFCADASDLYLQRRMDITASTAKLYKKNLFKELRFPKGKLFEDDWIIPMLLFSGIKIAALQNQLYYYYSNLEGITGTVWTTQKLDDCLEVLRVQNEFFYQHGFYEVLADRCRLYVDVFGRHSQKYENINTDKKYMTKRRRDIKKYIMKYKRFLPEISEYGYEAWARRKTYIVISFKNDVETIKKEKGKLYAFLWKIMKAYPIYKEIKNDT